MVIFRPFASLPAALLLLLAAAPKVNATVYTVVDLTPNGYSGAAGQGLDGGTQVGSATAGSGNDHAIMWSGSAQSFSDLNPATATSSVVFGVSGNLLVGRVIGGNGIRAGYWVESGAFQNLPDAGYDESQADGVSGNLIVGFVGSTAHAAIWTGSPTAGYVLTDLQNTATPTGFLSSVASGTDGTHVAGSVFVASTEDSGQEAAVWNLTANTFTNLGATDLHDSDATAASGNQVVGFGSEAAANSHALLWVWNGSGYDRTDLNPAGALDSIANGTNGTEQVGSVDTGNPLNPTTHAFLWSETTDGLGNVTVHGMDLEDALLANPATADLTSSVATGIDAEGDVIGLGMDADGNEHAILWEAVAAPEAGTLGIFAVGMAGLLRMRRRS